MSPLSWRDSARHGRKEWCSWPSPCSYAKKGRTRTTGKSIRVALVGVQRCRLILPSRHLEERTAQNSSCPSSSSGGKWFSDLTAELHVQSHHCAALPEWPALPWEPSTAVFNVSPFCIKEQTEVFLRRQPGKGYNFWQKGGKKQGSEMWNLTS